MGNTVACACGHCARDRGTKVVSSDARTANAKNVQQADHSARMTRYCHVRTITQVRSAEPEQIRHDDPVALREERNEVRP